MPPSRRHRALGGRHAGSRHRLFSRCRRLLAAGALARRGRHASGADRRTHRRGRRDLLRPCRRSHCRRHGSPSFPRRSPIAARRETCGRALDEMSTPPAARQACRRRGDGSIACFGADESRISSLGCATAATTTRARRSPRCRKSRRPRSRSRCATSARRCHSTSVEQSFQQEYRIALACIAGHDFIEGIRAAVIDKDRNPVWRPDGSRMSRRKSSTIISSRSARWN